MPTLREKMNREMILIGVVESTQAIYLKALTRLYLDFAPNRHQNIVSPLDRLVL